jgi:hypothetical protein
MVARVVTEAGQELAAKPKSFKLRSPKQQQQQRQVADGSSDVDGMDNSSSGGKAAELGACAVVTDTFLSPADTHGALQPTQLPATGHKAPSSSHSSSSGGGGSSGGVVVCDSTVWSYGVTVGPFDAGQCAAFKVGSRLQLRLHCCLQKALSICWQYCHHAVRLTMCRLFIGWT